MEQISLEWEQERRILSVAELTRAVRELLGVQFGDIWVTGEISGTRLAPSGHYYFTLKDEEAQLRCACFRGAARLLRFKPEDGVAVLARGRIDVYAPRGDYQLLVEALEPRGHGALQLAFEKLKKKLESEGLFAQDRKRPLPAMPRRIGIVTSPTGAAVRDMIQVLGRRFPGAHIRLYPALVQGHGAPAAVVEGIRHFGSSDWAEVLIVGRGGGSLEDLWTFNEEAVARAIAACPVPVVSAVGHETDFTIADLVADLRAPTPSAAAELVVPERRELLDLIATGRRKLEQAARYRLAQARNRLLESGVERGSSVLRRNVGSRLQRVDELDYRLREKPQTLLAAALRRVHDLEVRLGRQDLRLRLAQGRARLESATTCGVEQFRLRLAAARARHEPLAAQVRQLSPLRILARGYAIVQNAEGGVVREAASAPAGADLGVRLWKGRLRVKVTESSVTDCEA